MHPYVYKKHHKLHHTIALFLLFSGMIFSQPASSSSNCNLTVKKISVFSEFSKGFLTIEGNKVITKGPHKSFLYKVTIDRHYMLLYHMKSGKFICWSRNFRKLVSRRNPTILSYCKFEDRVSKIKHYDQYYSRYTSTDDKGKEVEMLFNNRGVFPKPKFIENCVKNRILKNEPEKNVEEFLNEVSQSSDAYTKFVTHCANPDFMVYDNDCVSGLPLFCKRMKILIDKGHRISTEINDLCKKEWRRNN